MQIAVNHPNVISAELQGRYDEPTTSWERVVVVQTNLDPTFRTARLAEEIIGAANRAMGNADIPDGQWIVLILTAKDPDAQGT